MSYYVIYTRLSEESEEWNPIIDMDAGVKFKKVVRKFPTMAKVNGAVYEMKLQENLWKVEEVTDDV